MKRKKRKIRIGRLLIVIVAFMMFIALVLGTGVFAYYKVKTMSAKDLNVVILGVDGREETQGSARADTVMLLHVNKEKGEVSIVSLPRDAYVYIPCEKDYDKLTHAYSYGESNWANRGGGRVCTMESVRGVFELEKLDNYMQVDFFKMIELVDEIGGIDLVSSHTFCEMDEQEGVDAYCFEEGKNVHMNGAKALAYARHRKSDSDIYRAQRQQEVLKAMVSKAKSLPVWELYSFANKALATIDTNLNMNDLVGYLDLILEKDLKLNQMVVEGEDAWIYEPSMGQTIYYYQLLPDKLQAIIKSIQ
ncbi:MAG: LCP family protein [Erysipelotrichaceae bacterium]